MAGDFAQRMALDALGLLSDEEQDALARDLAEAGMGVDAGLYDAGAALALACPPIDPPASLKARVLDRIAAQERPAAPAALSWVMSDEGWMPHPVVSGIRFKQLALDEQKGVATLLLKVAPGTVYPAHHHSGHEECYVVEGDVIAGGRVLHAGDFHHASAGSHHQPLSTVGGCTVLLVVDARDYLGEAHLD
ncbi:MAG: cupin domain-containing protein [Vicinamibacterales bacterium]